MKNIAKFIKDNLIGVIVVGLILLVIILMNIMSNDMESHIEKVSKECASQGYGIKAYYTNQGDKFYKCDKDGDK